MTRHNHVDATLKRIKNNKLIACVIVVGMVVITVGNLTDAFTKITEFYLRLGTSGEPENVELIENISQYVINGSVDRVNYSGDVIITPVGLFRDPRRRADGSATGYTFLLCRFTNTGDKPITIGAIVSESKRRYRLDDPGFGYRPVATSMAQWQGFFRGRPISPMEIEKIKERLERRKKSSPRVSISKFENATLLIGETKYGYVNSLGHDWPSEITLSIIDLTDRDVGTARLRIHIEGGDQR